MTVLEGLLSTWRWHHLWNLHVKHVAHSSEIQTSGVRAHVLRNMHRRIVRKISSSALRRASQFYLESTHWSAGRSLRFVSPGIYWTLSFGRRVRTVQSRFGCTSVFLPHLPQAGEASSSRSIQNEVCRPKYRFFKGGHYTGRQRPGRQAWQSLWGRYFLYQISVLPW